GVPPVHNTDNVYWSINLNTARAIGPLSQPRCSPAPTSLSNDVPSMTAVGRLVRRGLIAALAAVIASTAGLGQNRVRQANIGYISPSDSISINEYFRGVRKGVHAQNIADQLNF